MSFSKKGHSALILKTRQLMRKIFFRVKLNMTRKEALTAYFFLLIPVLFFTIFHYYPIISSLVLSFTNYNPLEYNYSFVGFHNYLHLFEDREFLYALKNTFFFTTFVVGLEVIISLTLALALNKTVGFLNFFKIIYFLPVVASMVAASILWKWIYHPRFGILNYVLQLVGLTPQTWLNNEYLALPCIIAMSVWKHMGFNMLIFLAGLKNIPDIYYETAIIDGASKWQNFRYITLPLLRPITLVVVITSIIGSSQVFTQVYVLTSGGPMDATRTLVFNLYEQGFRYLHMGYASAIAFFLLGIVFLFTFVQLKVAKTRE